MSIALGLEVLSKEIANVPENDQEEITGICAQENIVRWLGFGVRRLLWIVLISVTSSFLPT
jgi:hypothetical protein